MAQLVREAKEIARRWVAEEGSNLPGFGGAFFHGSVNWLADEAELPATSDVDVMVVLDGGEPSVKLGKFVYEGVLLEVSYVARALVEAPDVILGHYQLAGSFRGSSVIADPSGGLTRVQARVSREFAHRAWVEKRCRNAREKVLAYLAGLDAEATFHDQVMVWLFAAGLTTHVLLTAGLANPTVRRRYVAVRELLADYGQLSFYEALLEPLGCARMTRGDVEHHLHALAGAFDAAVESIRTPFFFASDISDVARPIAIDGSRALIGAGLHREAVFWIVATWSRCQKVLHQDASGEVRARHEEGYRELLGALGVHSFDDLQRSGARVKELLVRVGDVADGILAANPAIEDPP